MPRTKKKKSSKKNILFNIITLVVTLLICLLAFEFALRIVFSDLTVFSETSDLLTYHPVLGIASKPNLDVVFSSKVDTQYIVQTNSKGWRDNEFELEKSKPYRIHVYGDSFTYGVGANQVDIFTERLEKEYFTDTEVLNFGLIASGNAQQHIYYDKVSKEYPADAVVLAFFVGNDFLDAITEYETRPYYVLNPNILERNNLLIRNFPPEKKELSNSELYPFPLNVHAFLSRHSYTYNFVFKRVISLEFVKNILKNTEVGRQFFLYTEFSKIYLIDEPDDYKLAKLTTKTILKKFKEDVESTGVPFYVAIIPSKEMVNDEYWDFFVSELYYSESELQRFKPTNDILEICYDLNMNCVDLLSEFRASEDDLYFSVDAHTNKFGHDIIARVISERLINDGVVQ